MLKIYHNPRCAKSREGLSILEKSGKDYEIVLYLKEVPTKQELQVIIKKLGISPIDLVRTTETIWKERYKNKKLSDDQIITAMIENPKLIERPIVLSEKKAVIGRPPSKITMIL